MCEPTSIIMGATALVGAMSQKKQADYKEAVAEQNQEIANEVADSVEARGAQAETDYRIRTRKFKGGQRTAIAASGLEMSGSALDILEDTAETVERDAQNIRLNAAREAYGYRTQGLNYGSQARMINAAGNQGAAGTILSGAANAYTAYQTYG